MKNKILLILKKELREMFRDKKSLAMMLIIPFMIPALVIGFSMLFESESETTPEDYNRIGFAYKMEEAESEIAKSLNIEATFGTEEELKEKYQNGELDTYVTKSNSTYTINGNASEATSYASTLVESYFNTYKNYLESEYLSREGINPSEVLNIISLTTNITQEDSFISNYIVVYAFMFIIMAITVSATYPSTDATAGEKERGTLETLLTFPIKSKDIIIGKFLSVTVSSVITGVLGLILMLISLKYANGAFEIYKGTNLMLNIKEIIVIIGIIISYSCLISGLCIAVASKSKTFKEAQSALTPLTFISFFPGMIAYMANLQSNAVLSLIPFLNFTLVFNDMVEGNIEPLNLILMFASTIVIIVLVLFVIIRQYKSEKVLFAN